MEESQAIMNLERGKNIANKPSNKGTHVVEMDHTQYPQMTSHCSTIRRRSGEQGSKMHTLYHPHERHTGTL